MRRTAMTDLVSGPPAAAAPPASAERPRRPLGRGTYREDRLWTAAFIMPYAAVFLVFTACPIGYGLWMAGRPALYAQLADDPIYLTTLFNTLLFVGVGVNLKMFLALLLSGFFLRPRWWIKALLVIYLVPWPLAAVQAFISVHWILIGDMGLVNRLLEELFGIEAPIWFNYRWTALAWNIAAHIWKWMPFWTVIFIAARLALPRDVNDAAAIDGATGVRRFVHVTFPMLANLYLVCTLLSTLWTIGDFNTVYFVSGGAPVMSTDVLATLAFRYTFDSFNPALGIAAVLSALPVMIPVGLVMIRRFQTREVGL